MVYILVPTFGRIPQTEKFIDSIQASINEDYLVLIIDDHPENVTLKSVEQNEKIKILASNVELWWVGSINFGIQNLYDDYDIKDSDIIVFANNDIQIDKQSFNLLANEIKCDIKKIVHPRTINEKGIEVSSGTKIISYFPYITVHPMKFSSKEQIIDMGTARFLMTSGYVLKQVKFVNKDLIQYGGDNDFTLSAKRFFNINTFILRDAKCILDDSITGIKNQNIKNTRELYESFFSIKSPNNIRFRYILFKRFFGKIGAFFITLSLTFNTLIKFFLKK